MGDEIKAIDGRPTSELELPTVRDHFKEWPTGRRVKVDFLRRGRQQSCTIQLADLV